MADFSPPEKEFNLTLKFSSMDGLEAYLNTMEDFIIWREKRAQKKLSDRRGQHILGVHLSAKAYHNAHPELSYRECMREVSKHIKELNKDA
jgi:hypothetical protein